MLVHTSSLVKDMPERLSKVAPNASVIIGNAGDRPLMRHPFLAALAIEAIASWSNVESFMLRFFVTLLGGDESLATAVYLSLEGAGPKMAAINAAARSKLGPTLGRLELFKALLAIAKTNERERNKLAHWTWGDSPDLPNAVLLVNPRATSSLDRNDIYVYYEQQFQKIIADNDRLCGYCLRFQFVLQNHVANRDNRLFDELCAVPEIREKLDRRKDQQD